MKTKHKKQYILGLFIILLIAIGFFYTRYTHFSANTITALQIINDSQEVLDQFNFDKSTPYTAYDMRTAMEYSEMDSKPITPLRSLRLINRLKNTKTYAIIAITEKGIILKDDDHKSYMLVPHASLISSSKSLASYYKTLMPSTLYVNQTPLNSVFINEWAYLSYDQQWITMPKSNLAHPESKKIESFNLQGENILLNFNSEKSYALAMLKVIDAKSDQIVYTGQFTENTLFIPDYDGDFHYQLQLIYNDNARYRGDITAKFDVHIDRPIKVTLDKNQIEQGDYSVLSIQYASEADYFTVEHLPYEVEFFKGKNDLRAILYADYRTKAGDYPFIVKDSSNGEHWPLKFKIVPRKFHIQQLVIDESVAKSTKMILLTPNSLKNIRL